MSKEGGVISIDIADVDWMAATSREGKVWLLRLRPVGKKPQPNAVLKLGHMAQL